MIASQAVTAAGARPKPRNYLLGKTMDQNLVNEWQALKKEHDDAHHHYLYVHGTFTDRVADALKGLTSAMPLHAVLEAHEAVTERWYLTKRKLHAFCRAHEDVC
jgi:hypothetical protein